MEPRCPRVRSALLCLGVFLLQAASGTTVIPLCEPNDSENCTTALVKTESTPRAAQVGISRCKPEMQEYCFHGQCMYLVDLDEYYCRCDLGFSGVRCMHSELVTQRLSKEYLALTIILVLFFLTAAFIATYYFYQWYQHKKSQANSQNYKEVDTHEKNSTLLHL
ncbi:proepiregulin [Carettochelys insculpta]|uniref:proepiregulin n=1 Tax=Carettochelys insculpta TaxID=44489 RepID=UPI003EBBBA1C